MSVELIGKVDAMFRRLKITVMSLIWFKMQTMIHFIKCEGLSIVAPCACGG